MNLIQRHYLKEFLKTLCIISLSVSVLFSIVGLIERMREFAKYAPPKHLLLAYVLYAMPGYLNYLLPGLTLFSVLFVFSQAAKRLEIVAIKMAGAKLKDFLFPFFVCGVILTLLGFLLSEVISPKCAKKLHSIRNQITNKAKTHSFREGSVYMRGKDGSIIKISLYLPEQKTCRDISIFKVDDQGLVQRIESPEAVWTGKGWMLRDVLITNVRDSTIKSERSLFITELDSPELFQAEVWKPEEMTVFELMSYRERLNRAGFKNMKLTVDIASRFTYAFVNLVMLVLGLSLALSGGTVSELLFRGHRGTSNIQNNVIASAIGVVISLIYWFGYTLSVSLGYAGAIPPLIAPAITPMVFAFVCVLLYRQIQE